MIVGRSAARRIRQALIARIAELEETTAMKNRIITEVSEALRPILQRLGLARAKFARWTASIDVPDARCRRRRGEFYIGLSRAQSGGAAGRLDRWTRPGGV